MLSNELFEKVVAFNRRYSVKFDVEAMERAAKIDAAFDSFNFDRKSDKKANAERYYNTLTLLLDESLTAKTKINSTYLDYDLGDFNIMRFINDFEEIIAQRNNELENPRSRAPFEGMKYNALVDKVKEGVKPYNKTVYGIWADKITKNKITYKDLQAITDTAISAMDSSIRAKSTTYSQKDLTNVVLAKAAMEQVRQSRTRWWKFWHLLDNYREQKYLEALTEKVEAYKKAKLPVDTVLQNANKEMLKKAYEEPVEGVEKDAVKVEKRGEKAKMSPVADLLRPALMSPDFVPKTADYLAERFSCMMEGIPGYSNVVKGILKKSEGVISLPNKIDALNKQFDAGLAEGKDLKALMETYVNKIGEISYDALTPLNYVSTQTRLATMQVMTDYIMKNYSPVTQAPEQLKEFGDCYILKNPAQVAARLGIMEQASVFFYAQEEYNDFCREGIEVPEAGGEPAAPKGEPVQPSAPVVSPPFAGNN